MEAITVAILAFVCLIVGTVAGVLSVTVLIVRAAAHAPGYKIPVPTPPHLDTDELAWKARERRDPATAAAELQASRSPAASDPQPRPVETRQKARCALCEAVRLAIRSSAKKLAGR